MLFFVSKALPRVGSVVDNDDDIDDIDDGIDDADDGIEANETVPNMAGLRVFSGVVTGPERVRSSRAGLG